MLPIIDDNGKQADINLVNIDQLLDESEQNALAYLYTKGSSLLIEANAESNRMKAREAYEVFMQLRSIERGYKDIEEKIITALEFGRTIVLIIFEIPNLQIQQG